MSEKVNVLIVSDNIITNTGVANQTAEIAKALFNKEYGVYQIGVGGMEPAKQFLHTFPTGEQVQIVTDNTYDNVPLYFHLIHEHNIKAVILVTDPHKFLQVWINARTIKNLVPIIYWNLWDTNLLPTSKSQKAHYNQWIYESCDSLPCISQQSENFVKQILNDLPQDRRPKVSYIPHGSNEFIFKPLPKDAVETHRETFFRGKKYEYVVLFNGRNQTRKKATDLIYAWQQFFSGLSMEQSAKVALVLHTEAVTQVGTDLNEVIAALAPDTNIYIDYVKRTQEELNILYNISDVTFNVSNAEGFGLPIQESLLAGTPIAATVTGGLQDQMGFNDDTGKPMTFNKEFTSNATHIYGKFFNYGEWCKPIFPVAQEIIGSPATPYLFNDVIDHDGIKDALLYWYKVPREERKERGLKGREYCYKNNMTTTALGELFTKEVADTIYNFKKHELFTLYKA